jgi:peptidoglycan/xylan/chitin deacetylase (PgdA/CDA1 family)
VTTHSARAYAAAVHRLKELPDAERADRLETLLAALGADVTEPGPFRLLSWDEAHELTRAAEVPCIRTPRRIRSCRGVPTTRSSARYPSRARSWSVRPVVHLRFSHTPTAVRRISTTARRRRCAAGVRWALSTTHGFADGSSDPLALPRIGIGSDLSPARFRLLVSGVSG